MAYTMVISDKTVFGNKRTIVGLVTTDAESGVVYPGLGRIDAVSFAPVSMGTAGIKIKVNAVTGTSAGSGINIAGAASGDDFYLTIYGR